MDDSNKDGLLGSVMSVDEYLKKTSSSWIG